MDANEIKEAGNALVHWFNTQELTPEQSLLVMRKVIAKIILKKVDGTDDRAVHHAVNALSIDIIHDVLDAARKLR